MSASAPVRTTCPYCGVGCGVLVSRAPAGADGTAVAVSGDPEHPANRGRLCSKGGALGETLGLDGRLLEPRIDGRAVIVPFRPVCETGARSARSTQAGV